MRSFPCALAITARAATALAMLDAALAKRPGPGNGSIPARLAELGKRNEARRAKLAEKSTPAGDRISPEYLSRAIGETVGDDAIIFNEYSLQLDHRPRTHPGTFFARSPP